MPTNLTPCGRTAARPPRLATLFLALLTAAWVLPALPAAASPAFTGDGATKAETDATPAVRWYRQVEPALAEAERSGRLVMVDLYAEWCSWCKLLDVEFNTPHFKRWAQDYVLLQVDVEDGGEGTALQTHLGVSALPTTALMDHEKVRVGELKGFKPAPQLTRALDREVAEYRELRLSLDERGESPDRATRLAAADELRSIHAGSAAAEIYRSVLADAAGMKPAERARVGAALADALLMSGDHAAAQESLATAREAAAEADEETRFRTQLLLDNLALRIYQEMEGCEQAAELETFLAQRPSSSYAGQVERRLEDLRSDEAAGCS